MKFSLLIILLFLISNFSVAKTPKQTYLLHVPLTEISTDNKTNKVLLVSMPTAAAGFDTAAQLYIRKDHLLEYYSKTRWIDTPARMLLPLLVNKIEGTGIFRAVLSATTIPIVADLRLDSEILRFQQEFLTEPSQVRVILRVQLLDMKARRVIATRVFEALENAPSENAEGGMLATNQAVSLILKKVIEFIDSKVKIQ
jgi:cholesterol transport system auxiliary component